MSKQQPYEGKNIYNNTEITTSSNSIMRSIFRKTTLVQHANKKNKNTSKVNHRTSLHYRKFHL